MKFENGIQALKNLEKQYTDTIVGALKNRTKGDHMDIKRWTHIREGIKLSVRVLERISARNIDVVPI